jgi:hypothetical protein
VFEVIHKILLAKSSVPLAASQLRVYRDRFAAFWRCAFGAVWLFLVHHYE